MIAHVRHVLNTFDSLRHDVRVLHGAQGRVDLGHLAQPRRPHARAVHDTRRLDRTAVSVHRAHATRTVLIGGHVDTSHCAFL